MRILWIAVALACGGPRAAQEAKKPNRRPREGSGHLGGCLLEALK